MEVKPVETLSNEKIPLGKKQKKINCKELWKTVLYITIPIFVCVVILTFFLVSLSSLNPNEMGLDYDPFNASVGKTKLYFQGRYFLGVGHYFIKFPIEVMQLSLSKVKARTKVS